LKIGQNIKRMRLALGLTQEELAARTELTKGFISQLERDIASPSIATLMDILETLGSDIADFFNQKTDKKVVFTADDMFEKVNEESGCTIRWLVTSAQKNDLEPILVTLTPGGRTAMHDPHEGEEFGYVLLGYVTLCNGESKYKLKKGDSYYFQPNGTHWLANGGKTEARVLWVCTPPSF